MRRPQHRRDTCTQTARGTRAGCGAHVDLKVGFDDFGVPFERGFEPTDGLFVGALGVGGIALAFAFQDILENFVAGIILGRGARSANPAT